MSKKQSVPKTYEVVRNLKHDGELYAPGDKVEMSADQAQYLVDSGTLKEVAETKLNDDVSPADDNANNSVPPQA